MPVVLEELREVGSLAAWDAAEPVAEDDFERRIWLGLREILASGELSCGAPPSGKEAGAVEQPR